MVRSSSQGVALAAMMFTLSSWGCARSTAKARIGIPPDAKPSLTYWNGVDRYSVYVLEQNGKIATHVCIKYRQTGSRLWRNSCEAGGPPNVTSLMNPRNDIRTSRAVYGRWGQTPPLGTTNAYKERAASFEKYITTVVTSNVDLIDLDENPDEQDED